MNPVFCMGFSHLTRTVLAEELIVLVGMDPSAKTRLVESLTEALENVGILTPHEVGGLKNYRRCKEFISIIV